MKNLASALTPDILEIALEMQGWDGRIMGTFAVHFNDKGKLVSVTKTIIAKVKERKGRQSKSK